MALTMGYNAEDVRRSINSVIAAYDELARVIGDNIQNDYINPMAQLWACKEARTFFKSFKDKMDVLNQEVFATFKSVVDSMNSAAVAWSKVTSGFWASINTFLQGSSIKKNKDLSIDCIKENIEEWRGINDVAAKKITDTQFAKINSGVESALEKAKNAVQNSGFKAENRQDLINALTKIQNSINNKVQSIIKDANEAMSLSVDKYKLLEKEVSNAFQGNKS